MKTFFFEKNNELIYESTVNSLQHELQNLTFGKIEFKLIENIADLDLPSNYWKDTTRLIIKVVIPNEKNNFNLFLLFEQAKLGTIILTNYLIIYDELKLKLDINVNIKDGIEFNSTSEEFSRILSKHKELSDLIGNYIFVKNEFYGITMENSTPIYTEKYLGNTVLFVRNLPRIEGQTGELLIDPMIDIINIFYEINHTL